MTDTTKTTETKTSIAYTTKTKSTQQVKISSIPRKFLVHFRRPIGKDKFGKLGGDYDGSYGFDWLRDEYIYDIVKVFENDEKPTKLYRGNNLERLKKEYTRLKSKDPNDLPQVTEIKTRDGETYLPAWLAIFANNKVDTLTTKKSDKKLPNGSGIKLYLQIDQEKEITDIPQPLLDDGTNLIFETSEGIEIAFKQKISTNNRLELSLANFISKPDERKYRNLGKSKIVYYYANELALLTITATKPNASVGYIKVIAEYQGAKRHVGVLMIYPNINIPTANIQAIKFNAFDSNDPLDTNNFVTIPNSYKDIIQNRFLNQALINAVISPNIIDIQLNREKTKFNPTDDRRKAIEKLQYDYPNRFIPKGINDGYNDPIRDSIINIFEKLYPNDRYKRGVIDRGWIDSFDNKTTYLIFTNYHVSSKHGQISGVAFVRKLDEGELMCTGNHASCTAVWSNVVVYYSLLPDDEHVVAHEVGHSLGLSHTFQADSDSEDFPEYEFYRGYTDNIMDYKEKTLLEGQYAHGDNKSNPFKGNMRALFKWQWDIMRVDRSVVIENNTY